MTQVSPLPPGSSRRQFLARAIAASAGLVWAEGVIAAPPAWAEATTGPFQVPPLPYAYEALEPVIDRETMHFHHDKHHAAYVNTLNKAIAQSPELQRLSIEEILKSLNSLPAAIRTTVRNHGGGHHNHSLFWESMSPQGGGEPGGELAAAIARQFGSFAQFQTEFEQAGLGQFGSGWVWLVAKKGKLAITQTANQDSPLLTGQIPLLGNDVWEHAYYLTYRNRRNEYLKQWWRVVNWPVVEARYAAAVKSASS